MAKFHPKNILILLSFLPIIVFSVGTSISQTQSLGEPEEPDFFFVTGGPYTQQKGSPQIIWANQLLWTKLGNLNSRDLSGSGRFELGLTDRWELDFEFGFLQLRERLNKTSLSSEGGSDDLLFGIRYRLLDESVAPFTLTLGPQVIAPVASRSRGLGVGRIGYAGDITLGKDWGHSVFAVTSINGIWRPNVPTFPDGSGPQVDLAEIVLSAALGFRAIEHPTTRGTHHDLHVFTEINSAYIQELETREKIHSAQYTFAPGVRYGFTSSSGNLTEVGLSLPIGLNNVTPGWGFIVQFQFEMAGIQ